MLGKLIKEYLNEKGLKYSAVADQLRMPKSAFSALLNGRRKITAEEYFKICYILEVDLDFFQKQWNEAMVQKV